MELYTGTLADGSHAFTATSMDAAGNISLASQPVSQTIGIQNTAIAASAAAAVQTTAIVEPAAAASANYNKLAFDDEFNSSSLIDMSNFPVCRVQLVSFKLVLSRNRGNP